MTEIFPVPFVAVKLVVVVLPVNEEDEEDGETALIKPRDSTNHFAYYTGCTEQLHLVMAWNRQIKAGQGTEAADFMLLTKDG